MKNPGAVLLPFATALLMAGCATPYQPGGLTGGFKEQKIDETTYRVSFNGNGNTPRDMVWNYWIYRCAELTKTLGYANFALSFEQTPAPKAGLDDNGSLLRAANYGGTEAIGDLSPAKGGGTYYYYVPGYTVTTYHANGTVHMFNNVPPLDVKYYFRAQPILDALKAYVTSSGKTAAPSREDILKRAGVDATKLNSRPATSLDDYKDLLPAK